MQKKNKQYILLITLGFFLFLWWKWVINILFFFQIDSLLRPIGYYGREIAYNTLLAKKWADEESFIFLREHAPLWREADRAELLWDTLFFWSGSPADILSWYEQSLALEERSRVREKVALLQKEISSSGWQDAKPLPSSQEKARVTESGMTQEVRNAQERIQQDAKNRTQYLEKPGQKYIVQDTIEFLNLDEERIDW